MNVNEQTYYAPWKWLPTPDRFIPTTQMKNVGGFAFDTHGNVHRQFYNTDFTLNTNGFNVGAYQMQFSNDASISVFSRTGSTSGYWNHAITMLFSYNDRYRHFNYQDGSLSGMEHIVVLNMGRKDYGDRIKSGSLKITLDNLNYLNSRIALDFNVSTPKKNSVDLNNDGYVDGSDYLEVINNMPPNNIDIVSITSDIDSRITVNNSITSDVIYQYFYPYYRSNNELLIYDKTSALTSSKYFIGKLFPYDGIAILTDYFYTYADAKLFLDSITAIQWDTDIITTEFHAYCIKEPFILNYTTNPTIFKSALFALTSNSGYSYGRDGLTGNSGEFIDSISSISTYATTIGLYNDNDELLFVAKLPQAIKLIKELPYSFVVNVDFRLK